MRKSKLICAVLLFVNAIVVLAQAGPGPGKHQVALTCNPAAATVKFNFYRSSTSGTGYVKLTSTPQASCAFTDSTVAPSQSYFYVATGLDSSSSESSFSNEIKADIPATPTSPGGVLVDVGATKATLTWNAVTGATGYNIWRATGTTAPVQIGTVSGSSFVDTTIVAGQTYQWFVTTVTGTNGTESLLSAPAVVRPAPPTNLQVTIN